MPRASIRQRIRPTEAKEQRSWRTNPFGSTNVDSSFSTENDSTPRLLLPRQPPSLLSKARPCPNQIPSCELRMHHQPRAGLCKTRSVNSNKQTKLNNWLATTVVQIGRTRNEIQTQEHHPKTLVGFPQEKTEQFPVLTRSNVHKEKRPSFPHQQMMSCLALLPNTKQQKLEKRKAHFVAHEPMQFFSISVTRLKMFTSVLSHQNA